MLGMLIGGIMWGILGDKLGRMQVLFGSILLYSAANIGNASVHSVEMYALWRFLGGFGLAGELGAGICLVAELLPARLRGYGTTIVATIGMLGAIVAGITGELTSWRVSYVIGGLLGLLLLFLRVSVHESEIFSKVKERTSSRGDLKMLFGTRDRVRRYVCCILIGLPIWFVAGILVTLAPEMAKALQSPDVPRPGLAVSWFYVGLFFGDFASGLLSQYFRSRKTAIAIFLVLSIILSEIFLHLPAPSVTYMYAYYILLGFASGFWVLVVTTAAEQFGTNLRATVTTTVPNFIRGAVVPMTTSFVFLKGYLGVLAAASVVGITIGILAALGLTSLKETFSDEMDFVES